MIVFQVFALLRAWLDGLVVRALDSQSTGPGFASHPLRFQIVYGPDKLLTQHVPLSPHQGVAILWYCSERRDDDFLKLHIDVESQRPRVTDFVVLTQRPVRQLNAIRHCVPAFSLAYEKPSGCGLTAVEASIMCRWIGWVNCADRSVLVSTEIVLRSFNWACRRDAASASHAATTCRVVQKYRPFYFQLSIIH